MLVLNREATGVLVVKKSRFIAHAAYVATPSEARAYYEGLRARYYDARHIPYAYIIDDKSKSSDDKEPKGTAGMPILSAIREANIGRVILCVVRYFGGVLLGASALASTYHDSALLCLRGAINDGITAYEVDATLLATRLEYGSFEALRRSSFVHIVEASYKEAVYVSFVIWSSGDRVESSLANFGGGAGLANFGGVGLGLASSGGIGIESSLASFGGGSYGGGLSRGSGAGLDLASGAGGVHSGGNGIELALASHLAPLQNLLNKEFCLLACEASTLEEAEPLMEGARCAQEISKGDVKMSEEAASPLAIPLVVLGERRILLP